MRCVDSRSRHVTLKDSQGHREYRDSMGHTHVSLSISGLSISNDDILQRFRFGDTVVVNFFSNV